MSGRFQDTILSTGFAEHIGSSVLNPKYGGQHGHATDFASLVSSTPYVSKPLIPFMVRAPGIYNKLPGSVGKVMAETLKSIMELHSETIEGLNSTVTMDFAEQNIGGASEVMESVIKVNRERSVPSHAFTEKAGESIVNFFLHNWVYLCFGDPDSNIPHASYIEGFNASELLDDDVSMIMCYVEPDTTWKKCHKAFLVGSMKPKGPFDLIGKRDKRAGGEQKQFNIEFTGIQQVGKGVNQLGQALLDRARLTGNNPYFHQAFVNGVDPNVDSGRGYLAQMDFTRSTAVR